MISVAETLRQISDLAIGSPPATLVTAELLRDLAHRLEPDYVTPLRIIDDWPGSNFEEIVFGQRSVWLLHRTADSETWRLAYERGYSEPRFLAPSLCLRAL